MRIIPLGNNGTNEPAGVALCFEVDDETLGIIASREDYYMDRTLVDSCFQQTGRNAHVYLLVGYRDISEILRKLRMLMTDYATVSWWTREHKKFYLRRGKL